MFIFLLFRLTTCRLSRVRAPAPAFEPFIRIVAHRVDEDGSSVVLVKWAGKQANGEPHPDSWVPSEQLAGISFRGVHEFPSRLPLSSPPLSLFLSLPSLNPYFSHISV